MTRQYPMLKPQEVRGLATIGPWKVLLWGFRVSPKKAIREVLACLVIIALMFAWIFCFGILQ